MKILNKQKTHFLKITKCGLYKIQYDTVKNVNLLINNILDNGNKKDTNMQSNIQSISAFKKELR
jgi:hypothetical protein